MPQPHSHLASNAQLNRVAQDLAENFDPQTLQGEIIKRFMPERQFKSFMATYYRHRKARGSIGRNRADSLSEKLTKQETDLLSAYLNETDTSVVEIESRLGLQRGTAYARITRAAVKYLYQNKETLVSF